MSAYKDHFETISHLFNLFKTSFSYILTPCTHMYVRPVISCLYLYMSALTMLYHLLIDYVITISFVVHLVLQNLVQMKFKECMLMLKC